MLRAPEPPLADGVVLLRPPHRGDAAAIVEACQDPEIARWTRVPHPYTEEDALTFLTLARDGWRSGTDALFLVTDARSGRLLGSVGLHRIHDGIAELGYWVRRDARSAGVATRAAALLATWALEHGIARLELLAEPGNPASQRVAEKAGFVREGVLRSYRELKGSRRDYVMFSRLPSDR